MTDEPKRIEGPTPSGGAYAVAARDGDRLEVTEHDGDGKPVMRTYSEPVGQVVADEPIPGKPEASG